VPLGTAFERAIKEVVDWLDGTGAAFANRVQNTKFTWELKLDHPALEGKSVQLFLPHDFPASLPWVSVAPELCLKLPHVESTGKVCLAAVAFPGDFDNPCAAVVRVLEEFRDDFLAHTQNPAWVLAEFHAESLSYWNRFCLQRQEASKAHPVAKATYLELGDLDIWAEGAVAGYIRPRSKHRRCQTQIACFEDADPHLLAQKYGWDSGTLVRGRALFVNLPVDEVWTPSLWPKDFIQLANLVGRLTADPQFLLDWMRRVNKHIHRPRKGDQSDKGEGLETGLHPVLVCLVQVTVLFGYQIFPASILGLTLPEIQPIEPRRIDPAWALTRDHVPNVFTERQNKKVAVLGCGSLASPLIELLARSGIGEIDIVDSEFFEIPNVSRHSLGMGAVGTSKAIALANKILKDIPGARVTGHLSLASTWVQKKCKPDTYDLVIDCTAEADVRIMMAQSREVAFGQTPVVHAWVEPFCCAAHVVLTKESNPWPADDPADALVNSAGYSNIKTDVDLPACNGGFHPYGAADIHQAAAFTAERVLSVLDNPSQAAAVWSWVRSKAFFDSLNLPIDLRPIVPTVGGKHDSVMVTRSYIDIFGAT
jgi:sulfur-carrier protein adenylyltransferase/sulfurtransferase